MSCIASLKGHVLLRFPMSFETISFDPPDRCVGEVREVRGVRIVLKEYRVAHGALFVKVNAEGTPVLEDPPADWPKFSGPMRVADLFGREDVRITAIGGRTLNTVRSAGSGCSGEGATRYRHVEIEFGVGEDFQPGPVIVTCTVGYFYDGFNFELKDIPFPR
ncbi:MAG: hypothetical protein HYY93_00790 [Planctomycetes bacterium]|nr:hypothetical protein [Planctomycetota bacterium]